MGVALLWPHPPWRGRRPAGNAAPTLGEVGQLDEHREKDHGEEQPASRVRRIEQHRFGGGVHRHSLDAI